MGTVTAVSTQQGLRAIGGTYQPAMLNVEVVMDSGVEVRIEGVPFTEVCVGARARITWALVVVPRERPSWGG